MSHRKILAGMTEAAAASMIVRRTCRRSRSKIYLHSMLSDTCSKQRVSVDSGSRCRNRCRLIFLRFKNYFTRRSSDASRLPNRLLRSSSSTCISTAQSTETYLSSTHSYGHKISLLTECARTALRRWTGVTDPNPSPIEGIRAGFPA